MERPIVSLDDTAAADRGVTGAKAANLARARRAGLPALEGAVLTTDWQPTDVATALDAWETVSLGGLRPVVVRSSSTGEDGASSSMAGVFDSVLDVADEPSFLLAVDTVVGSADGARRAGLVDAPMAVLVQPMLEPRWGGVLFGADPVTGARDRLVVAAVPGGPSALVAGEVDGWTAVLDRRGRVREVRAGDGGPRPGAADLRALARLAARAAAVFGGPQDLEWAIDADGRLVLLQARPITTLAGRGPVFGPGPVAETFPEPLSPLEQDLWLAPLRDGLREALRLAGTAPAKAIESSPLVVAVDGAAAVDLDLIGAEPGPVGFVRRLDPRPPARRLRAAWRVGRLRAALPDLAGDAVRAVDRDLLAVPPLRELGNHELLAVLRNAGRALRSLHGHEALAGLLIPDAGAAAVTGASLALSALAQARSEGVPLDDLARREPVVLAVVPPRVGPLPRLDDLAAAPAPAGADPAGPPDVDPAAVAREALRLRIRWVQELGARAAWELGRRLVRVGVLPSRESVRLLSLAELEAAVHRHATPAGLASRTEPAGRPLPARFRLGGAGVPVAAPAPVPRRRRGAGLATTGAVGAGGGTGTGPVHLGGGDVPIGSVLVVAHLDPRLAPVIPRLAGLVAETGNPLSHLAILAREHHVPVVVGYAGATERFAAGEVVTVDGLAGTVEPADRSLTPAGGAA